jgi:hypothetical protein
MAAMRMPLTVLCLGAAVFVTVMVVPAVPVAVHRVLVAVLGVVRVPLRHCVIAGVLSVVVAATVLGVVGLVW